MKGYFGLGAWEFFVFVKKAYGNYNPALSALDKVSAQLLVVGRHEIVAELSAQTLTRRFAEEADPAAAWRGASITEYR